MASEMEVDGDLPTGVSNLKRSSSAPMINLLADTAGISSTISGNSTSKHSLDDTNKPSPKTLSLNSVNRFDMAPSSFSFRPVDTKMRSRHYSTSSLVTPNHSSNSVSTPIKVPSRVHQIKHDEEVQTNVHREIKHERHVQTSMQMSQSWDEHFTLDDPSPPTMEPQKNRPRSLSESLHIFTSGFPVASSPSPTRVGKQCFSPSMQAPVILNGNFNFTPSPSPSPTRRVARRSLSPIVTLKPSALTHKRKLDPDSESGFSQPKRIFTGLSGSLLSPASLHIASQLSSQPNHLVQQVHHNNQLRHALDMNSLRQQTHSSMSTGSFDDSASEHSSVGTMNHTNATTCSSTPCGTGGFSPLATIDTYSTTTTDSESDMFDCSANNNNNNNTRSVDSSNSNSASSSTSNSSTGVTR